jgi:hypothetical protein
VQFVYLDFSFGLLLDLVLTLLFLGLVGILIGSLTIEYEERETWKAESCGSLFGY